MTGIKWRYQQDCSGSCAGTVVFQETVKHQGLCCGTQHFCVTAEITEALKCTHWLELDQNKATMILVTKRILLRKKKTLLLVHSQIEGASECQRWSIHTPNGALGKGKSVGRQDTEKLQRQWNNWPQSTFGTSGLLYFLSPATALEQFCECRGFVYSLEDFLTNKTPRTSLM